MDKNLKQELLEEIEEFQVQTNRFLQKELSVKEFKGYSGGFGSYAQRGAQSFMLRLRMNQGVITKDRLKFICDVCEEHQVSKSHFTTCQTIQLHDLTGSEIPSIMKEALDHDIVCRGGGGDFPRNVMCSPLSGVDSKEAFDVRPYAEKTGEYLLSIINKYTLPRKLKVAFSNSAENETHATFRDLGFVANEDHTFDVYCAGGLGNNPKMGVKVGNHVPCKDILYYVSTMVLMFMEFGNYENRAKARTRYMQETLGSEQFVEEFKKKVELAKQGQSHDLYIKEPVLTKTGDGIIEGKRIFKQKQDGLYAVFYHPICGMITPAKLKELYTVMKDMEDVEIRITPQQSCYIINLTASEAQKVLAVTEDGARTQCECSVSCIGASTCQVGLRDSNGMLKTLIYYLRDKNYADNVLPKIFVSGCTSSCGTNQIGEIGLQGTIKVIDKKPLPAYQVSLYGNDKQNNERFGDIIGVLLEDDVCLFFDEIASKVSEKQMTYTTWKDECKEEFDTILNTYIKPLR